MSCLGRVFSILLVSLLAVSSLIMVESAFAESIPKPSVPEFTVALADQSYEVPAVPPTTPTYTIDPYSGKQVIQKQGSPGIPSYHVKNITIDLTILNQPYPSIINGNASFVFFNVRLKGHFGQDWTELFPYYSDSPVQSNSQYTVISLPANYQIDDQIDIQVQAAIGYKIVTYIGHPPIDVYTESVDFQHESSDWSPTQTITILADSVSTSTANPSSKSTATSTPNPTSTIPPSNTAAVRYLQVENVTVEDFHGEEGEQYPATHYTLTFALFKVNEWSDRIYFTTYVRDTNHTTNWYLSFSKGLPPGNAGGGGILDFSNYLNFVVYTAEFPYMHQTIYDTKDGLQTYYFYRVHLWLNGTIHANYYLEMGADYMKQPQLVFHSPGTIETTATGSKDVFSVTNKQKIEGITYFALSRSNPSYTPTATPFQSNTQTGSLFGFDTLTSLLVILFAVVAIVLVTTFLVLKRRTRHSKTRPLINELMLILNF